MVETDAGGETTSRSDIAPSPRTNETDVSWGRGDATNVPSATAAGPSDPATVNVVSPNVSVRPALSSRPSDSSSTPAGIGSTIRTLRSTVMQMRGSVCSFASEPMRMSAQVSSTDGRSTPHSGTQSSGWIGAVPRRESAPPVTARPSSEVKPTFLSDGAALTNRPLLSGASP